MTAPVVGPDGLARCAWASSTADYLSYHDQEWGRPVHGELALYERITLEAFQSGLSWITILRKREGFRAAFAGFDPQVVAGFGEDDVTRLMADASIVRNQAKIRAAVVNAAAVLALRDDGGLDDFVWSFAPTPRPARLGAEDTFPATTAESKALAKALKAKGFAFVGPTTAYAAMQACGLVDDHVAGCHVPPSAARA
ncbi:DNA-3-methyladenine glycosylase I [Angustibacter sp. McL0619]|uniref:DNA-3-methyladenine glycosylase I n=1 Tax=Angustibacter sp. McL0619 TaxID=3415676 RepID=UPI003CE9B41A